ncbi:MAG: hypothetical protein ABL895_06430 [Cyclobacteriaceae bacterium]
MKKVILFLSIVSLFGFTPSKLIKTKVAEGITVSLPPELAPMTTDDIVQRYPSVRAPLAAYTDLNRTLDFSVNISATQWPDANLEMAQKFFKASIHSFYDRVDMINEGIHDVHKKKLIFFEFESRVNGNKMTLGEQQPVFRYTYIQYLVEPERTLVFTFSSPKASKEDWQENVRAMMKTIRIK